MARFVVRIRRGGPWDFSRDMREQHGWDDHARYMDELFDSGFILFAGPLEGDQELLWMVEAESKDAIRARMAGLARPFPPDAAMAVAIAVNVSALPASVRASTRRPSSRCSVDAGSAEASV